MVIVSSNYVVPQSSNKVSFLTGPQSTAPVVTPTNYGIITGQSLQQASGQTPPSSFNIPQSSSSSGSYNPSFSSTSQPISSNVNLGYNQSIGGTVLPGGAVLSYGASSGGGSGISGGGVSPSVASSSNIAQSNVSTTIPGIVNLSKQASPSMVLVDNRLVPAVGFVPAAGGGWVNIFGPYGSSNRQQSTASNSNVNAPDIGMSGLTVTSSLLGGPAPMLSSGIMGGGRTATLSETSPYNFFNISPVPFSPTLSFLGQTGSSLLGGNFAGFKSSFNDFLTSAGFVGFSPTTMSLGKFSPVTAMLTNKPLNFQPISLSQYMMTQQKASELSRSEKGISVSPADVIGFAPFLNVTGRSTPIQYGGGLATGIVSSIASLPQAGLNILRNPLNIADIPRSVLSGFSKSVTASTFQESGQAIGTLVGPLLIAPSVGKLAGTITSRIAQPEFLSLGTGKLGIAPDEGDFRLLGESSFIARVSGRPSTEVQVNVNTAGKAVALNNEMTNVQSVSEFNIVGKPQGGIILSNSLIKNVADTFNFNAAGVQVGKLVQGSKSNLFAGRFLSKNAGDEVTGNIRADIGGQIYNAQSYRDIATVGQVFGKSSFGETADIFRTYRVNVPSNEGYDIFNTGSALLLKKNAPASSIENTFANQAAFAVNMAKSASGKSVIASFARDVGSTIFKSTLGGSASVLPTIEEVYFKTPAQTIENSAIAGESLLTLPRLAQFQGFGQLGGIARLQMGASMQNLSQNLGLSQLQTPAQLQAQGQQQLQKQLTQQLQQSQQRQEQRQATDIFPRFAGFGSRLFPSFSLLFKGKGTVSSKPARKPKRTQFYVPSLLGQFSQRTIAKAPQGSLSGILPRFPVKGMRARFGLFGFESTRKSLSLFKKGKRQVR